MNRNKFELKKYIKISILISLSFIAVYLLFSYNEYRTYNRNYNNKLNLMLDKIQEQYPDTDENDLIRILNSKDTPADDHLDKYGIDIVSDAAVSANDNALILFLIISIVISAAFAFSLIGTYLIYNRRKDRDISEIEAYVEQINRGNYRLNIDNNTEDELSILKNEVYKTMIMLKENAENLSKDKLNLKTSLEDISHQLKTPLTSIMIALENLEDEPEPDMDTRERFLKMIRRNTQNISFLVQSILKLSKFDTNTVEYIKDRFKVSDIIREAVSNTETLCDLKNIELTVNDRFPDSSLLCDRHWQSEALTNILKNAAEHAEKTVSIDVDDNNAYLMISVTNDGPEIDPKDTPHLFERFYKGRNSSSDSVGIGLSLALAIVKNDNGNIEVDSIENKTTFSLKYYK